MRKTAIIVMLCLGATTAAAEPKPWAAGISADQQAQANALFAEGNQAFGEASYPVALAKYRAAVALWRHPMIEFNMAVTLVRLDRLLEAADALDAALQFGDAPFTPELFRQANDYKTLIAGRIGTVEASCTQAGARISLDGKQWFACPGSRRQRVLAGEHAVVAEAPGFMTAARRVVVPGGAVARAQFQLVSLEAAGRVVYPTPRWIPWTIAAGGAALVAGGAAVWSSGRSELDHYETDYSRTCAAGCATDLSDHPSLRDERDSAMTRGTLGTAFEVAGGVIAAGGLVWALVLDRPHRVLPSLEPMPGGGAALGLRGAF